MFDIAICLGHLDDLIDARSHLVGTNARFAGRKVWTLNGVEGKQNADFLLCIFDDFMITMGARSFPERVTRVRILYAG